MFREVGNGVMFFLAAMAGMYFGVMFWGSGLSHGPEEHNRWAVEGAIGGTIAGSAAWLAYKYRVFVLP